jgi:protein-tyrosine phosphatase/arsenate reductase
MTNRSESTLDPQLSSYVAENEDSLQDIAEDRRAALEEIARFIDRQLEAGRTAKLTFICTHNSRRSHMAQLWAQAAAAHYGVPNVAAFSGGTEATAFNPRAVAALRRAGFRIEKKGEGDNPVYDVRFAQTEPPLDAFSKVYNEPPNPRSDFCAVMTCSQADEACPVVEGATARVSIPYDDPKEADGTGEEASRYDERCRQICREMLYAFSRVERSDYL